jgi:peptide/nickel transport system permease protein
MLRYVLRRILYAIPILLGVSLITFVVFYATATPEQMARHNISSKNPSPEQIKQWLTKHGYDKPLHEQAIKHVRALFLLDFGRSDSTNEVIWDRIKGGWIPSFYIGGAIFLAALIIDISLALAIAYFRGTYVDIWGTFLCVLLMSIVYMVYIIGGQFLLGKVLKYAPLAGFEDWRFVVLPMTIGVISGLGGTVRLYRTFMLDEMNQDYVRTARAKGVAEQPVLFRHVLKNAAIPILTSVVLTIPLLITGSLLLERFFAIPGLGSYLVDAINSQDFAVVRAMVFLGAILYIIGAIMTDISYALVDPRVRLE